MSGSDGVSSDRPVELRVNNLVATARGTYLIIWAVLYSADAPGFSAFPSDINYHRVNAATPIT